MRILRFLVAATAMGFITACEKEIDIRLEEPETSLVVDASIENGEPPIVILSRSLAYFSKIDPTILSQSFVKDAEVYVGDGSRRARLRAYTFKDTSGFELHFYAPDPADPLPMIGRLQTRYTLEITHQGKPYKAETTIPSITRRIDSLWWEPLKGPLEPGDSNKAVVMLKGADKPGLGNYIRYFTSTNNGIFLPGFNSVFDDDIIDGKAYTVTVDKGIDRNRSFSSEDLLFRKGDTVDVKISEIDRGTYDFWRTMEFSYQSIGNPFSSPVKVMGNISNGALGCFAGYASQVRRIIIPRR